MRQLPLLASIALVVMVGSSFAQTVTATLVGTVTDASGAVVTGAAVTVVRLATDFTRTTQSDSSGNYTLTLLPPGTYQLSAQKEGFKHANASDFQLQVDQTARVDIALAVGSMTESLSVTAAAPLVASETSSVGQVINEADRKSTRLNSTHAK